MINSRDHQALSKLLGEIDFHIWTACKSYHFHACMCVRTCVCLCTYNSHPVWLIFLWTSVWFMIYIGWCFFFNILSWCFIDLGKVHSFWLIFHDVSVPWSSWSPKAQGKVWLIKRWENEIVFVDSFQKENHIKKKWKSSPLGLT